VRVWVWESMRKTRELPLFEIPVIWSEVRGRSMEGGTVSEVCLETGRIATQWVLEVY